MKRILAAAMAAFLAAQGAWAGQIVLKWGCVMAPTHIVSQTIERIGKNLAEKTGGGVIIQGYPGSQLGSSHDMIEAVSMGMQELVIEGSGNIGSYLPSISILESPYVWRDADHISKTIDGPIGQEFSGQLIAKAGMRIMGAFYYGSRHITSTVKEIRHPSDLAGFKLRVPENEVFLAMAETWGARPTPMTLNELYLALKQNVVDGQENPLPTIESSKFDEVQKYLILTGHIITPLIVLMNEGAYQKLSDPQKKALHEAMAEGIAWNNREIRKREDELAEIFASRGMTVIRPDRDEFSKPILEALPKKFENTWGKGTWEKIQAVK
ncbi:MAG: sialic acid TRAP transporter substrate-binding protein SiaP [Planctomycetota bacterium]|jgi:tripartite ATP-independent transporter DctP family solute receptor|nr:sialic acid TRAP transporter substrate-binding protein SiaP [Planctomycetota bacterium]